MMYSMGLDSSRATSASDSAVHMVGSVALARATPLMAEALEGDKTQEAAAEALEALARPSVLVALISWEAK